MKAPLLFIWISSVSVILVVVVVVVVVVRSVMSRYIELKGMMTWQLLLYYKFLRGLKYGRGYGVSH